MVKLLFENGADVNIFNRNRYTPLMTSCRNSSLPVVKYFIAHGSDYRIVNQFEESAAHIAYHYENFLKLYSTFLRVASTLTVGG